MVRDIGPIYLNGNSCKLLHFAFKATNNEKRNYTHTNKYAFVLITTNSVTTFLLICWCCMCVCVCAWVVYWMLVAAYMIKLLCYVLHDIGVDVCKTGTHLYFYSIPPSLLLMNSLFSHLVFSIAVAETIISLLSVSSVSFGASHLWAFGLSSCFHCDFNFYTHCIRTRTHTHMKTHACIHPHRIKYYIIVYHSMQCVIIAMIVLKQWDIGTK